ncbi:MAG: DUF262 domain-containing HNH endonuclease family protein [Hyphomicrobiales bacterium]|nr:DUF262 domain-containing HNH endonuclease family protein [Hyphomicrobiales bacterium]
MTTSITSHVTSLGSMLRSGDTYIVPPYQRNYSWEKMQFSDFWTDISKTFNGAAREYFLGSIVINNSQAPELVVIDGQQRLITTSVLIAALRSHLRNSGKTKLAAMIEQDFLLKSDYRHQLFAPSLILNRTNKDFYDGHIFNHRPVEEMRRLADDEARAPSNRLLADCFCYMYEMIGKYVSTDPDLETLANTIINALNTSIFVIRIDVKDDYNAFALFETLNDRGLELSEADLLKNHLLSISMERLGETQGNWEVMEHELGVERLIKFVRHHWLSTMGAISERGIYSDIKGAMTTPQDAVDYAANLYQSARSYAALCSKEHSLWSTFPHNQQPLLREQIGAIETLRIEQVFIVLMAAINCDKRSFADLAAMLVNFTVRYTTICNLSPSNLLTPFVRIAQEIRRSGEVDVDALFRKHLAALYPQDNQFHSAFSRKSIRSNAQSRYILLKINDFLLPNPSMRTQADPKATDVEHILPKRFENSWHIDRREYPGGADKYVYRLGNMTLISKKLNEELGNTDFDRKKKVYAGDCLEITQRVLSSAKWTADEIKTRQNWLASIACKIWRYPA